MIWLFFFFRLCLWCISIQFFAQLLFFLLFKFEFLFQCQFLLVFLLVFSAFFNCILDFILSADSLVEGFALADVFRVNIFVNCMLFVTLSFLHTSIDSCNFNSFFIKSLSILVNKTIELVPLVIILLNLCFSCFKDFCLSDCFLLAIFFIFVL